MLSIYGAKDAPLPHLIPMEDDITTLKGALNTTVAWPKEDLVSFFATREILFLLYVSFLAFD